MCLGHICPSCIKHFVEYNCIEICGTCENSVAASNSKARPDTVFSKCGQVLLD